MLFPIDRAAPKKKGGSLNFFIWRNARIETGDMEKMLSHICNDPCKGSIRFYRIVLGKRDDQQKGVTRPLDGDRN